MATKKVVPFFTYLGKTLNTIRSISVELNEEMSMKGKDKIDLSTLWFERESSFSKLQERLISLENEIAYFFTETGRRKAIDSAFNTQAIRKKFMQALNALSTDYRALKTGKRATAVDQQNDIHLMSQ